MNLTLNELTPEQFLKEYWQKKPLVIRQGLSGFQDLLTPEEMAGLACEDVVESRRVSNKNGEWHAEFGPFEHYEAMGDKDWTLIVQALNNWVPEGNDLIKCFDFIPRWRLDDLMVSYGTPGGGVGPHIDLYDVFICQGSGSRRWRVGDLGPHKEFSAHPALLHTEEFEPIIDVELKTGDILYIPPGFPHDGISLENSMSFSVGYRTDSTKDMHSALADYIIDKDLANNQIADPNRTISTHSGLVNNSDLKRIKNHLIDALDDDLLAQFSGEYLTRSKCQLDIEDELLDFTPEEFISLIKENSLSKLGGLRCLYFENSVEQGIFYVNGEQVTLSAELCSVIPVLCNNFSLEHHDIAKWQDNTEFLALITQWLNKGYWYFEGDSE